MSWLIAAAATGGLIALVIIGYLWLTTEEPPVEMPAGETVVRQRDSPRDARTNYSTVATLRDAPCGGGSRRRLMTYKLRPSGPLH